MSNDSGLFLTAKELAERRYERRGRNWLKPLGPDGSWEGWVPLYEAKLIHQFDHRWTTCDGTDKRDSTPSEKQDQAFEVAPRYWVPEREDRLAGRG